MFTESEVVEGQPGPRHGIQLIPLHGTEVVIVLAETRVVELHPGP